MDEAGIDKSIILPIDYLMGSGVGVITPLEEKHRMYAKAVERHPDRLTAFAGIDPRKRRRESFLKTLKYEEVYLCYYEMSVEVMAKLPYFIEVVYNQKRLHSVLGYLSPNDFED